MHVSLYAAALRQFTRNLSDQEVVEYMGGYAFHCAAEHELYLR
jgi:hypothetical protein